MSKETKSAAELLENLKKTYKPDEIEKYVKEVQKSSAQLDKIVVSNQEQNSNVPITKKNTKQKGRER